MRMHPNQNAKNKQISIFSKAPHQNTGCYLRYYSIEPILGYFGLLTDRRDGDMCHRLYRSSVLSLRKDISVLSRGQIYPL